MGEIGLVNAEHPGVDSNLLRPWLFANLVAFTVGGALGGGLLRAMLRPHFGEMTTVMEAATLQASSLGLSEAIFGLLVGTAQWLVLRRTMRAGWWVPATGLGWALAGTVIGFSSGGSTSTIGPAAGPVPPILAVVVIPALVVLMLGGVQWLLLRREFDGAGWWLLVNAGGLFAGLSAGLVVAKALLPPVGSFPSALGLSTVGLVAGPIYGATTWWLLSQLRRRRTVAHPGTL